MEKLPFLLGADPELFVVDSDGEGVPAWGMIPGTKKEPHRVKNGAVQVDGLALEFNIDPVDNEEEFIHNIESVMDQLRDMVPAKYKFSSNSWMAFTSNVLNPLPKEALAIGCDPYIDAYTKKPVALARGEHRTNMLGTVKRFAGGHVHFGWTKDQSLTDPGHLSACYQLAKHLDSYLGMPSLLFDPVGHDRRNTLLGKGGLFRPKPYGLEYRSLSNFWIWRREFMELIFRNAKKGFEDLVYHDKDAEDSNAGHRGYASHYMRAHIAPYQIYQSYEASQFLTETLPNLVGDEHLKVARKVLSPEQLNILKYHTSKEKPI